MKTFRILFWGFALSALTDLPQPFENEAEAAEIQFIEDFVLASDREKILEQLIPGTDVYYFYQCLHLQNSKNFNSVTRILNAWRQRHGETQRYRQIRNRQMLLTYPTNSKQTLDFLIDRLRPKLDHQRDQLESKPQLDTKLAADSIEFDQLKKKFLRRNDGIDQFTDAALLALRSTDLNAAQRRKLLSRLRRPNHPDLIDMILSDLEYKGSRGFGSLRVHTRLTIEQLESLSDRKPQLLNETKYVQRLFAKASTQSRCGMATRHHRIQGIS